MMQFPESHIIPAKEPHKGTIILLHGRGSNGKEFADDMLGESGIDQFAAAASCKWIFPSAPLRMSTIFQEQLTEWFRTCSIMGPESEREKEREDIRESIEYIQGIIREETHNVSPRGIILGGISQGFAVAAHVLIASPEAFGGFVGISGWIALHEDLDRALHSGQGTSEFYSERLGLSSVPPTVLSKTTPVILTHSADDEVVEIELGIDASSILQTLGFDVSFFRYGDGGHWLQEPSGYDQVVTFLENCLNKS